VDGEAVAPTRVPQGGAQAEFRLRTAGRFCLRLCRRRGRTSCLRTCLPCGDCVFSLMT